MRNDQNWNCFFHNLEASFFLATLVLKKGTRRTGRRQRKRNFEKNKKFVFFAIFGNARHLVTWSLVSLISPIDMYKPVPGVYHAKRSVIENGEIVAEEFEKREKTREICVRSQVPILPAFPFRHWPGREVRRKYIWAVKRESKEMDKQWHWDIEILWWKKKRDGVLQNVCTGNGKMENGKKRREERDNKVMEIMGKGKRRN